MTTLEQVIKERRISPTALAKEAEISYRYLLMVRHGQLEPTVSRASRIAKAISKLGRKRFGIEELWPEAA